MRPHYLEHLADLGVAYLHPLERAATWALISALDLRTGQHVLEVGCGTGGTMALVAAHTAVSIDGIDPLPIMCRQAQQRLRGATYKAQTALYQASGLALPFPARFYDRVYTESVLGFQNVTGAEIMLRQIYRSLKPNGLYVANEAIWKPYVTSAQAAAIYARCMTDFGISQASEQAWSLQDWLAAMQTAGFHVKTARRLEDVVAKSEADTNIRAKQGLFAAPEVNWLRRRLHFTPRRAWRRWQYRQRLRQHRADGQLIESYLFVLSKPDDY